MIEANHSYDTFSKNSPEIFNKYFPYVKMSRKAFKTKPHITKGIQVSIRNRNKLYKKYLNNPTDVNKAIWKKFRNKTSEIIRRAESLYYKSMISEHNNASRNLLENIWQNS